MKFFIIILQPESAISKIAFLPTIFLRFPLDNILPPPLCLFLITGIVHAAIAVVSGCRCHLPEAGK